MKMRVTVLVPIIRQDHEGKPYQEKPEDFYPHLQEDLKVVERLFPREAIVEKGEYVADLEDAKAIFKKFLKFKLEGGAPRGFKSSDYYSKGDEEAPFYSEAFLYNLLGKEDARTVLGYLDHLMRISGLDPMMVHRELAAEEAAERKAEEERQARIAKRRKFVEAFAAKKGWKVDMKRRMSYGLDDAQRAELRKALQEAGF